MKKYILFGLMTVFTMTLLGCSKGEESKENSLTQKNVNTTTASITKTSENNTLGSKRNIALVMKTLTNPFFIEMEKGARKAESELDIKLSVKTGAKETSIDQQIAIVDELINSKVDAIVIAPGSSTELIPVLKKAQDNKIQIVNIDNKLDVEMSKKLGLANVPFISVNNEEGAYLCAKYLSEKINKPTKLAILEGIRGADNAEQRKNGALRAFKENKNIQIVASEAANWKIDEALDVTTKLFSKIPDITAIFCANDMMALGAVQYMDKNKKKDVLIVGYDALEEARKAIGEGRMLATVNQQADVQGYTGVKYAFEMLEGKKEPLETLIKTKVIDASNLGQ